MKQVIITDGIYSYTDFIGFFNFIMDQNGDYLIDNNGNHIYYIKFDINPVYYGLTLTLLPVPSSLPFGWTNPNSIPLSGETPQIIIDSNNFQNYVGFSAGTYPSSAQISEQQFNSNFAALVSNITTVLIGCNLISSSFYQTGYSDILESFTPGSQYGSQLFYQPYHLSFTPCGGNHFNEIQISFYDQGYKPLQLVDQNGILVQLILRTP